MKNLNDTVVTKSFNFRHKFWGDIVYTAKVVGDKVGVIWTHGGVDNLVKYSVKEAARYLKLGLWEKVQEAQPVEEDVTSPIQRSFLEYHKKNPDVYEALVSMTRMWKAAGKKKVGIGMLFEVLRWNIGINQNSKDLKISNNHRSRYVRLIQEQEEDIAGMFVTRELTS